MVVEYNRRSTWTHPLREVRDAPLWRPLWWNDGARRQRTHHRHSATPLPTFKRNSWDSAVLDHGQYDSEKKKWYYPVVKIYAIVWLHETARTEQLRPKVGKDRVCILILWYIEMEMRWCLSTPGSAEYILPVTLSTSVTPVSQYTRRRSFKMYLEAVNERVWGCTWRPWSCEPAGRNRTSLEIHLEALIEQIWRCTWRQWWCELGGRIQARLEIHLDTVIERIGWCTWRP